jgi:hypothetical protein
MSGGGRLLEIKDLHDCSGETSHTFSVRTDGFYMPPTGWTNVDNADDSTWERGVFWSSTFGEFSSPGQSVQTQLAYYATATPSITNLKLSFVRVSANEYQTYATYTQYGVDSENAPFGANFVGGACSEGEMGVSDRCPTSAPQLSWPVSNTFQLSRDRKDNQFKPHPNDPNVPLKYQAPSSTISACTANGTPIKIGPTRQGGFAFYATDVSGNPTGVVQIYASDSSIVGYTDNAGYMNNYAVIPSLNS